MKTLRPLSDIENLTKLVSLFELTYRDYVETIPNLQGLGSLPFNEAIRTEMLILTEQKLILLTAKIEEYGFTTGVLVPVKEAK